MPVIVVGHDFCMSFFELSGSGRHVILHSVVRADVRCHMEKSYPVEERRKRLYLGGILYFILGLILIGIAFLFEEPESIFIFCGAILLLVGFFAAGYRKTVRIDADMGTVDYQRGFWMIQKKDHYLRGSFRKIEIRLAKTLTSRFSNLPNTTRQISMDIKYSVMLINGKEIEVERTEDLELARSWAKEIGDMLKIEVVPWK